MSERTTFVISCEKALLEHIDEHVRKLGRKKGRAFNRSEWISSALIKQLKIEQGFSYRTL